MSKRLRLTFLRVLWMRACGLVKRSERLNEEIVTHLDFLTAEHVARGFSIADARAAARREFGGVEPMKERYRDQRGLPFVDGVAQDVRYALRSMRRAPLFAAVAVLTLATGIGANTAMFSVADALVLRPLPVNRPDELRVVHHFFSLGGRIEKSSMSLPYSLFGTIRTSTGIFSEVMAFTELDEIPLAVERAEPSPSNLAFVTDNYFTLLGVAPRIGRAFMPGPNPEAVISDRLWRNAFNADRAAVGRAVRIGSGIFTVVGIAPPEFSGVVIGRSPDVFLPLDALPAAQRGIMIAEDSRFWRVHVIGRLMTNVSDRAGGERLTTVVRTVPLDPKAPPATIELLPLETGLSTVPARFLRPFQVLMTMVGILLVIACANVALMLLSRNSGRRAEIGTRIALGAARSRIVRQLMTEGAVMALAAGVIALLITPWLAEALVASLPNGAAPMSARVAIDGRVLLFTAAVSSLAVLFAAAAPAFRTSSLDRSGSLLRRTNTAGIDFRIGGSFVVAQIALAVPIVAGAGLLVRSLTTLAALEPGFDPTRVIQVTVNPDSRGYTGDRLPAYYRDLIGRLEAIPGVESVSFSQVGLLSDSRTTGTIDLSGFTPASDDERWVQVYQVGPRFFETYGMSPVSGSDFTEAHMSGPRTAIINERAARRFFEGTDPRGRQFRMGAEFEIIGVVRDARVNALRDEALPTVFVPYGHSRPRGMLVFAVRTRGAHDGVMASIVREARAIDPLVPMRIVPLERVRDASLARDRLLAMMSTFFAAAALALLAIGLFGLLTFRVQQRTTEIGVRLALGANVGTVVWLVLQQPLRLAAAGLVAGTALTLTTTGLLRSLLFGLSPTDVPTLTASVAAVVALVLLSACIPAWRAARLNPVVALRQE